MGWEVDGWGRKQRRVGLPQGKNLYASSRGRLATGWAAGLARPAMCIYSSGYCKIRILRQDRQEAAEHQRLPFTTKKPALLLTPRLLFLSPRDGKPVLEPEHYISWDRICVD